MALRINAGPYQRTKRSTLQIMLILTIALALVWLCGIIYSFILGGSIETAVEAYNEIADEPVAFTNNFGFRAIALVLCAVITAFACDAIWTLCTYKKNPNTTLPQAICHAMIHNYSYVTAIIFALTLPVYTNHFYVGVGVVFAVIVCKMLFGGFGKNVFNPAAMARILIGLAFSSAIAISNVEVLSNSDFIKFVTDSTDFNAVSLGIDAVSGATLTTAFNNTSSWLATSLNAVGNVVKGAIIGDYSMVDMLLGNYLGALGETFTLVILVIGIALAVLKVINWRTPVFYLGTVAVSALAVALFLGFDSPFSYVVYQLSLGGLMFGAVFMLTDPVTGPTSNFGKAFIGVFAGLLTMVIRIKGGYPEGVVFSIAMANFISPIIDYVCKSKSNEKPVVKYSSLFGTALVAIVLSVVLGCSVNGGKEVYEVNGIDKVQYDFIANAINLKEGDQIAKKNGYTIKTSSKTGEAYLSGSIKVEYESTNASGKNYKNIIVNVEGYKLGENQLDAVYDIVRNGEVVASIVTVKVSAEMVEYKGEYTVGNKTMDGYVVVALNNDQTVYAVGCFEDLYTKTDYSALEDVKKSFDNKSISELEGSHNAVGRTFSANSYKAAIAHAYAELFN